MRQPRGNLDPACTFPTAVQAVTGVSCYKPDAVWSTYVTDGTPYLVRRHTLDVFGATAVPANTPSFTSRRMSQYAFGTTIQGVVNGDGATAYPTTGTVSVTDGSSVATVDVTTIANCP